MENQVSSISEYLSNDLLGHVIGFCPLTLAGRLATTCHIMHKDFVWNHIVYLDVRDEWRTNEAHVVSLLAAKTDQLRAVEYIHCFPTQCVNIWADICMKLGPQLKYLQFGHPNMGRVHEIVARLDNKRLEQVFFAWVPPQELKSLVDRGLPATNSLVICGIIPNVPEQHMFDLLESITRNTGNLTSLILKLGNSVAEQLPIYLRMKPAVQANPKLRHLHIVHWGGSHVVLSNLFGRHLIEDPEMWSYLPKRCQDVLGVPLSFLRATGQTVWESLMIRRETCASLPPLDKCVSLFDHCFAETDFPGKAEALASFLLLFENCKTQIPSDYFEWIRTTLKKAIDTGTKEYSLVSQSYYRAAAALAAVVCGPLAPKLGEDVSQTEVGFLKSLLNHADSPMALLLRLFNTEASKPELRVLAELLKDVEWSSRWVKTLHIALQDPESGLATRLISDSKTGQALLDHPDFDMNAKRQDGKYFITWLLSNLSYFESAEALRPVFFRLLDFHKTVGATEPPALTNTLIGFLNQDEEARVKFASIFPDWRMLLSPTVVDAFTQFNHIAEYRHLAELMYKSAPGHPQQLPANVQGELATAVWSHFLMSPVVALDPSSCKHVLDVFPDLPSSVKEFVEGSRDDICQRPDKAMIAEALRNVLAQSGIKFNQPKNMEADATAAPPAKRAKPNA